VILDHQVKQIGGLFFDAGIELIAAEGLVDGTQGALESLVLFQAEQATETVFHGSNYFNCRIIGQANLGTSYIPPVKPLFNLN